MSEFKDTANFFHEQAELLGPDEAELDHRTEELLQRLEFTAMMRTGLVRLT